jgi:hypothetical protein
MNIDLNIELQKTHPDTIVYVPQSTDGSTGDTGNEHFLVFDGPDGSLMAVWTQSSFEGHPDQRIVFSRSTDRGHTWAPPTRIAGPDLQAGRGMASWGFPLVSRSGRIYVIYSRHTGVNDIFTHTSGRMAGIYSDDCGQTWADEQFIPMPRSRWDNPDPSVPANWIVWQKPLRLSQGKYYAGFTRWVSPAVRPPAPLPVWWAEASVVEFMRFENLDDDPEPGSLEVRYFMSDERALQVGLAGYPEVSVIQEPSIVALPDERLFCVMRTTTGHPYYTLSADGGADWSAPQPLRQNDASLPLLHPCSPCPIYQVEEGEYVFLFHNHDGHFGGWGPRDGTWHRRPIWLARGLFRPEAAQPVWFSEPVFFMDHGGVPILRGDLAMYASVTQDEDGLVLWYPERKFFLLGKKIPRRFLSTLTVTE